jgi:hypothetical protein
VSDPANTSPSAAATRTVSRMLDLRISFLSRCSTENAWTKMMLSDCRMITDDSDKSRQFRSLAMLAAQSWSSALATMMSAPGVATRMQSPALSTARAREQPCGAGTVEVDEQLR